MISKGAIPVEDDGGEADLAAPLGARPTFIAAPAVGAAAARGFYWLTTLSLITKALTTVTQIVLSWFVSRTDFGLVATTSTIATLMWLIQDAGLGQILIKRQRRFEVWATPVFWISLFLGLTANVLLMVIGIITAKAMHQPALKWLMILMAFRGMLNIPATVPWARLNADMRFSLLAVMGLFLVVLERGLMMLLTSPLLRWGAYGFIVAMLIVTAIRTAAIWWYGRPQIKHRLYFRRWKYVARDAYLLTTAQTLQTITMFGDNLLLALFRSQEIVGDYYWAFNLSMQTAVLLTGNLSGVLFSALSRLQREPERMHRGFVRAAKILTMVGVPGCILQAAISRPLVEMLFGAKWLPAIPALQALSLGMAMSLLNQPSLGLLRAQGRFSTERTLSGICAAMFVVAAVTGAIMGGSLSMGIAVSIYNSIAGILYLRAAMGRVWGEIISIYLPPWLLSLPSIGAGYMLSRMLAPGTGFREWWLQIGLMVGVGVPIYILAARWALPEIWNEMMGHLMPLVRRMGRVVGLS